MPPGTGGTSQGGGVTAHELSKTATSRLPIPAPLIKTAPPRGTRALVGMPHWFWLAKKQWGTRSAKASAGPVWAKATAHPTAITIDPGDGSVPFDCQPPWTPYTPNATPTCTHTFGRHGTYTATVTVHWGGTWTGSGNQSGSLPTLSRTARFTIEVVQARSQLIANP